jgi:hypothetical protein
MSSAVLDVPIEAAVVSAIGPAHEPIAPVVARTGRDLLTFARRFDASVEVYSPDPWHELMLLAPLLEPGRVALLFAPEGCTQSSAELVRDGATLSVHLVGDDEPRAFPSWSPIRYIVGFVVAEESLPAGFTLG